MRVFTFAVLFAVSFTVPTSAWADGPSGSEEKDNQVECGEGADTPAGRAYAGADGVELCSDDGAPPDGRIIVSFEERYAAADGDADNPEEATGFARIDSEGATCSTAQQTDATEGPGGPCG